MLKYVCVCEAQRQTQHSLFLENLSSKMKDIICMYTFYCYTRKVLKTKETSKCTLTSM